MKNKFKKSNISLAVLFSVITLTIAPNTVSANTNIVNTNTTSISNPPEVTTIIYENINNSNNSNNIKKPNKKVIKKRKSKKLDNLENKEVILPSIQLIGNKDFSDTVKKLNEEEKLNKDLIPIPSIDIEDYKKLKNVIRQEEFKPIRLNEININNLNYSNYSNGYYVFQNIINGQIIKENDIDLSKSFIAKATTRFKKINLSLEDITTNEDKEIIRIKKENEEKEKKLISLKNLLSNNNNTNINTNEDKKENIVVTEIQEENLDNLIINIEEDLSCASIGVYLEHKQYGPMFYNIKEDITCSIKPFISTYGAAQGKESYVDTSLNFKEEQKIITVSYIKEGWNATLKETVYGQPAINLFVDEQMNMIYANPLDKNILHYNRVKDINYNSYIFKSPFSFTANLENDKNYQTFFIISNEEEPEIIEGYIKTEGIDDPDNK